MNDGNTATTAADGYPDRWSWFESSRELQAGAYGKDPGALVGDERADYWTTMMFALVDEVSEFGREVKWKAWANGRGEVIDRDAAVGELVDAAHFLVNLALSVGATEGEFWERYREKQARNLARQKKANGYDGRREKCPACGRELDKHGAYRQLSVSVGSGAGTHEDVASGVQTYSLQCSGCLNVFDYAVAAAAGEKLP